MGEPLLKLLLHLYFYWITNYIYVIDSLTFYCLCYHEKLFSVGTEKYGNLLLDIFIIYQSVTFIYHDCDCISYNCIFSTVATLWLHLTFVTYYLWYIYYVSECYFYISTATLFLTLVTQFFVIMTLHLTLWLFLILNYLTITLFIYLLWGGWCLYRKHQKTIFKTKNFPVFVEEAVEICSSVCKRRQVCKLSQQLRRKLHLHGWESVEALGSRVQQQNEDVTCDKLATVVRARPITYTVSVFVYIHPCAFEHGNAWNLRSTATLRHIR